MSPAARFTLLFAPETVAHLAAIDRKYYGLIRKASDEQLSYSSEKATRNRKALEQPALAGTTWELRCGPNNRFRIFYDVDRAARLVVVLAIARKEGNSLFIGKEKFRL